MKIIYFTDTYVPQINGVSTAVDFGFKSLLKRDHTVYIVAPKSSKQKDKKNILRLISIPINRAFDYRLAIYTPINIFIKLLRTDFDIIHGHAAGSVSLMGLILAKIKRVPYVFTYHTMFAEYSHYVPFHILSPRAIRKISQKSCNGCNFIIAPTNKVKSELIAQGVKKPIEVIASGIETDKFQITKKEFLRKKLKLNKDNKILLFVGRLGKEKNIDFLIYAFNIILKSSPKAHFVIVGTGPQYDYLKSLSERLGIDKNVHFLGIIEPKKLPLVYNGADIFIFSSKTETQGLVILEAMASNLPVVAVKDEAIENVITNGENGSLVDKDTNTFAEEVLRLLKNKKERERLGKNGRKKAVFLSEEAITKLEEVYKKLLKKN